jgi:hypothetical protein
MAKSGKYLSGSHLNFGKLMCSVYHGLKTTFQEFTVYEGYQRQALFLPKRKFENKK